MYLGTTRVTDFENAVVLTFNAVILSGKTYGSSFVLHSSEAEISIIVNVQVCVCVCVGGGGGGGEGGGGGSRDSIEPPLN